MGNLYLSAPSEFSPSFSSRLSRPRDAQIRANFHQIKHKIVSPSARLLTAWAPSGMPCPAQEHQGDGLYNIIYFKVYFQDALLSL